MLPVDRERFNDLLALIEGPNPPDARQTGVREVLRLQRPETPARLAALLAGANIPARTAVAAVLADNPKYLDPSYVEPLIALLAVSENAANEAAAAALATFRDGGVIPRLRALIAEASQPLPARLGAINALGRMTQREAIAVLVEALNDPTAAISTAALTALERATALNFANDPARAQAWWEASRDVPLLEWQQGQIERLVSQNREGDRRLRALEAQLVKALRDNYVRTPETERPTVLQAYLTDAAPLIRLVGLDVVQTHLAEGQSLPAETVALVRGLLNDPEPSVRAAAVRDVASLRDTADADRFIQMLSEERIAEVRQALVNGLGYVGLVPAATTLLELVGAPDGPCTNEAVTALGRLAERGVLEPAAREAVVSALLTKLESTGRDQTALRERILWTASRIADPRFGPVFVAALAPAEAVTVRRAAVRGIAALSDPRLTGGLLPATTDVDASVRKTAVEALAKLAVSDAHLQALWDRLSAAHEPEAAIRDAAWIGVLRILAGRPADQFDQWIAKLPDNGPTKDRRLLELLQLAEKALVARTDARAELGPLRARIARQFILLGEIDGGIAAYRQSLDDLHAVASPEQRGLAVELVRCALLHERYDEDLAAALASSNAPLDPRAVWDGVKGEIERLLTPNEVNRAIAMLEALQRHPPTALPPDVVQAIDGLLERARTLRQ